MAPFTKSGLREAFALMAQEIIAGLRHGYFDFTVTGEKQRQGECSLTFKAGKSHRFRIPEDDLTGDLRVSISDPEQKGASLQPQPHDDQQNPDAPVFGNDDDGTGQRYLGKEV